MNDPTMTMNDPTMTKVSLDLTKMFLKPYGNRACIEIEVSVGDEDELPLYRSISPIVYHTVNIRIVPLQPDAFHHKGKLLESPKSPNHSNKPMDFKYALEIAFERLLEAYKEWWPLWNAISTGPLLVVSPAFENGSNDILTPYIVELASKTIKVQTPTASSPPLKAAKTFISTMLATLHEAGYPELPQLANVRGMTDFESTSGPSGPSGPSGQSNTLKRKLHDPNDSMLACIKISAEPMAGFRSLDGPAYHDVSLEYIQGQPHLEVLNEEGNAFDARTAIIKAIKDIQHYAYKIYEPFSVISPAFRIDTNVDNIEPLHLSNVTTPDKTKHRDEAADDFCSHLIEDLTDHNGYVNFKAAKSKQPSQYSQRVLDFSQL